MNRSFFAAALACASLLAPVLPACAQTPPTKADALAAISTMMRVVGEGGKPVQVPTGKADKKWAEAMRTVLNFAEKSPDVTVTISPRFVAATGKGDALFVAYFLAGAVRYDLKNPKKATAPYADQAEAVRAELLAYKYAKKRGMKTTRPLLETLQKADAAGKLNAYIADAAKQDAKDAKRKP